MDWTSLPTWLALYLIGTGAVGALALMVSLGALGSTRRLSAASQDLRCETRADELNARVTQLGRLLAEHADETEEKLDKIRKTYARARAAEKRVRDREADHEIDETGDAVQDWRRGAIRRMVGGKLPGGA